MTARPFTTALFELRCLDIGLLPSELDNYEYGMILDLLIERGNDAEKYDYIATQADFDNF